MIDYAAEKIHTETPGAVTGEEGLTYEDWPPRETGPAPAVGGPYGVGAGGPGADATTDVGQATVGNTISGVPWTPSHPNVQITQGYGATDVSLEPAPTGAEKQQPGGATSAHWHAGVDLGYPTATVVVAPESSEWWQGTFLQGLGQAVSGATNQLLNGGTFHHGVWQNGSYNTANDGDGYGAHAATLTLNGNDGNPKLDVILGHGMAYHQSDGAEVHPGDALISVDTEGNATGPHLHFEVRPHQGGYGTDVDPWSVLTGGGSLSLPGSNLVSGIGSDVEAAAGQIANAINTAESDAVNLVIGVTMAGGGMALLGVAAWVAFRGFRVPQAPRPKPEPRPAAPRHPEARVARATRAAPAAPQIPRTPSDAQPVVNSSREASRAGLGPSGGRANERTLRQRSRAVSRREIAMRQRMRAQQSAGGEPPF